VDLILEKYRIQKYCIGKSSNREIYVTQTVVFSYTFVCDIFQGYEALFLKSIRKTREMLTHTRIYFPSFSRYFSGLQVLEEKTLVGTVMFICLRAVSNAYAPVTKTRGCGYGKCAR